MAATSHVGNYQTGTYNTTTATTGGSSVTSDSSTGFMDELFNVMNANANQGTDENYSSQNNNRQDSVKNDKTKTDNKDVKKAEKTETEDSVENEPAGETEASEESGELKSEESNSSEKDGSSETDKESENDSDVEASDSQNTEGVTDGSNAVADVKPEFQMETVTDSDDAEVSETTSDVDSAAKKSALDGIAKEQNTESENASQADSEAIVDADNGSELVNDVDTDDSEETVIVDEEAQTSVDEVVTDEDAETEDNLITEKQQEKEVKSETDKTVKADETAKTEKTEVITAKDRKDEQNDQDFKQEDYKKYEYDYTKSSAASAGHENAGSGMNSRQQSQDKNYAFTDDIAAMSGMSSAESKTTDVNEALGLDKTVQVNEADLTRNVENVVKSVKTMVQNGNSSMVVRLDPPELGQLNIKISSNSNGMSIEIQATNAKAQTMLQQNSGQLKSALENSGINVNNVDVSFKAETKNGANAGSDSRDSQQDFTGQQNNQNFSGQSDNESGESYRERFSTWSNTSGFQESEFAAETQQYEEAGPVMDSRQELSFDTVDVTV